MSNNAKNTMKHSGQEHPIGKVKDFIYRVEFKIRGSCHYQVTAYFFLIENIPQDISCDTRDVLVQYINSVIKTDIPDEIRCGTIPIGQTTPNSQS